MHGEVRIREDDPAIDFPKRQKMEVSSLKGHPLVKFKIFQNSNQRSLKLFKREPGDS